MKNKIIVIILMTFGWLQSHAQLQVISTTFNGIGYNTPIYYSSTVNNSGVASQAIMEVTLSNAAGVELIYCQTNPFLLPSGTTVFNGSEFSFSQVNVSNIQVAQYIVSSGMLPSGLFNYCLRIYTLDNEGEDEHCKEIENNSILDLFLVWPADEDSIYNLRPSFIWSHTEPFNLLSQGEYFKMVVTEIQNGQSPEAAISTNTPLFFINNLTTHQVNYPVDANSLEPGKSYAWQVTRISGNNIIQATDVWKFSVPIISERDIRFVELNENLEGPVYVLNLGKLYFRFDERYNPGGNLRYKITDFSGIPVVAPANIDLTGFPGYVAGSIKNRGYNQYELDFSQSNLEQGLYTLEISDELGRKCYLKFKP